MRNFWLFFCGLGAFLVVAYDDIAKVDSNGAVRTSASAEQKNKSESIGVAVLTAMITPAAAQSEPKPSPEQAKLVDAGKELFAENCEGCHQADAIGQPGLAPSLTNPELLSVASDKFFISTITDGREGTTMMAFGEDLTPDQIKSIVVFLRAHEKQPSRSVEVDAQPDTHGDPRFGRQWFDDICSTCHGVNGDGYQAGGTGTAIGTMGFLSKASDGFIRETIKYGRSNTRMRGFSSPDGLANLSDQEIDDIIAYLHELGKKNAALAAADDDDD